MSIEAVLTLTVAAIPLAAVGIRWAYLKAKAMGKREAQETIQSRFIKEMATNHLPHIYHVEKLICERFEIEVTEPPPIRFVDVDGNGKK